MQPTDQPSKTRRKKDMHALQDLGAQLVELSSARLQELVLPPDLREAVLEARRITAREAHRRQLQFIGRLMRDVDPEPIREKLSAWSGQSAAENALHHAAERWREALLANPDDMTRFAAAFPGHDLQPLRTLVRGARKEIASGKPPRHNREIYRMIRSLMGARPSSDPDADA